MRITLSDSFLFLGKVPYQIEAKVEEEKLTRCRSYCYPDSRRLIVAIHIISLVGLLILRLDTVS